MKNKIKPKQELEPVWGTIFPKDSIFMFEGIEGSNALVSVNSGTTYKYNKKLFQRIFKPK